MPQILIVDGNPEHQRALGGLIRYRTESTTVIADSCVEGARIAVRDHPDVILVNVLLYVDGQFAFQRALGMNASTESIPILVHCSGEMEELTRRRVEANGAAGVLELPVNAEELVHYIDQATRNLPAASGAGEGVRPVAWPQAQETGGGADAATADDRQVKPVDWGAVSPGSSAEASPQAPSPKRPTRPRRNKGQSPVEPVGTEPNKTNGPADGFRSSSFRSVDPSEVKGAGKPDFEETQWPTVDPAKARNPRRGRGK
jgi:CheY-like chemotaxis protein